MKQLIFIFICATSLHLNAQNILSFQTAVARTLENNFDIRIEKLTAEQVANSNNVGNAGYLPTVNVNADQYWSSSNTRQEFFSGQINNKNNAKNKSLSANVRLDWTFFDGFAMFAKDQRLQLEEDKATQQVRAQMEMTLYQLSVVYYSMVYQKQMNDVYKSALSLSRERLRLAELKKKSGAASDLVYLQAKLDLNADSANWLAHNQTMRNLKTELAAIMGSAEDLNFEIDETQPVLPTIDNATLLTRAKEQNTQLLIQKSNIAIVDAQRKELQSRYYPQLSMYAQYVYGNSQSQVGVLASNQSLGPGIGLTLKWSILDRLSKFTDLKNNTLQQESNQLLVEQRTQLIQKELQLAYDNYTYSKSLYNLENDGSINAEEIFKIAETTYTNGAMTALELREIQFSIIQTRNRQLMASLALYTSILDLQLISGDFKRLL